jgi:hypothetical protein
MPLLDVDGEGQEVDVAQVAHGRGAEDHRVAGADDDRAARLLASLPVSKEISSPTSAETRLTSNMLISCVSLRPPGWRPLLASELSFSVWASLASANWRRPPFVWLRWMRGMERRLIRTLVAAALALGALLLAPRPRGRHPERLRRRRVLYATAECRQRPALQRPDAQLRRTKIDVNVILPPPPASGADGPYPTIGTFPWLGRVEDRAR